MICIGKYNKSEIEIKYYRHAYQIRTLYLTPNINKDLYNTYTTGSINKFLILMLKQSLGNCSSLSWWETHS